MFKLYKIAKIVSDAGIMIGSAALATCGAAALPMAFEDDNSKTAATGIGCIVFCAAATVMAAMFLYADSKD